MERKVPASSTQSSVAHEAALDAAMARASRPALPPGLAARIIAQATTQPQFAAGPGKVETPVADLVGLEPVTARRQVIPFAPVVKAKRATSPHNRRLIFGSGLAVLAASLVAVLIVRQAGTTLPLVTQSVPAAPAKADLAGNAEVPLQPNGVGKAVPHPHFAGAIVPTNRVKVSPKAVAEVAPTTPQTKPAQPLVPVATQLATSDEPITRDVAGPKADPTLDMRTIPNGGLMGPPAQQQGWAFTGGAPGSGGTLPGGKSVPSHGAPSMPPPPPAGGHP